MFVLNLICSLGGSVLVAALVETIIAKWEKLPLEEEPSTPIYITKEIYLNET